MNTTNAGDVTALIDNVSINRVSGAVGAPEPGSLALLGTGLIPLVVVVRRRSHGNKTAA